MKVHYLFYWHEALRHPEVERTRVPIRYDPFNIGVVYAYVHGQWVPCHSQYYAAFVGHSEKELALATEVLRQQARMSHRTTAITPVRLAEFWRRCTSMNACWCSASAIRKRTRFSRALRRVSRAERCEEPRLVYPRHPLWHTRGWKTQTFLIQWICRPYLRLRSIGR